jgi:hypothetical protein
METLFSDLRIRSDLIEKGQERLQSFRSEDMVAQYLASFNLMLQKKPLYKNEVSGVYGDLWTGGEFSVAFESGNAGRFIEMVIELPSWTPHSQTMLEMKLESTAHQKWKIIRGEEIVVSIPLSEHGGFLSFGVGQTFSPAKANMGEDHRHLGVRCKRCILSDQDQHQIVIWPPAAPIT